MSEAIGIVSGIFGIISFFQSNFPQHDPHGAKVQIKAGLGDDSSDNLGGYINSVYGYDYNNNYIGQSGGGGMGDGGVVELTIDQNTPGIQSDYVSIQNSNDAVCIAWISVEQYDDSPGGAWTGDIGKNCGQNWYYGNQQAGNYPDGSQYRPYCSWLDADHTHDFPSGALKFRVRAYGEESQDTINNNHVCQSTIFQHDSRPIDGRPQKRAVSSRTSWMEEMIIMSSLAGQTAEELCSSETSKGPDFVGTDGKFCDMESKTLMPLCSVENIDKCVEIDAVRKTVSKRSFVANREGETVVKSYKKIAHWDE